MNTIEELESYLNQKFQKLSEESYYLYPEKIELKENSNYEKYIILFESNLCKLLLQLSSNTKFEYNKMVNELNFYNTYKEKKELLLGKRLTYKDKLLNTSYAIFDINKFPFLLDDEQFLDSIISAFHSLNYDKIDEFYKIEIKWRYQIDYLYKAIGEENLNKYINEPITLLYELKIINILLQEVEEISENKNFISIEKNPKVLNNPYPLVFKTGKAYHLFLEVFRHEKIRKISFSNYYTIFKKHQLIHRNTEDVDFLCFINKEYSLETPISRLRGTSKNIEKQEEVFITIRDSFLKTK